MRIRRISRATSERTRKKDPVRFFEYSALAWIFNIPDLLQTEELRLGRPARSKLFPWPGYWRAMGWPVLFGTVMAVDISSSQFLLDDFSIRQLISVATVASIFIIWLVLPWFIFRGLGAGIPGPSRTFLLYDGPLPRFREPGRHRDPGDAGAPGGRRGGIPRPAPGEGGIPPGRRG